MVVLLVNLSITGINYIWLQIYFTQNLKLIFKCDKKTDKNDWFFPDIHDIKLIHKIRTYKVYEIIILIPICEIDQ